MLEHEFADPFVDQQKPKPRTAKKRCPLTLPQGWRFVTDSNEAAGDHKAYDLPGAVVRKIRGPFDYTLESPYGPLDDVVGVERKSLPNILLEATYGRERWERSLGRMLDAAYPCVVVETSFSRLLRGDFAHSKVHPNAVIGSILAWSFRHRVPIWMAESRPSGEMLAQWWLTKFALDVKKQADHPVRGKPAC